MKAFLLIFIALFSMIPNAKACLGPSMEEYTFLEKLPQKAFTKDIIALVEIISTKGESERKTSVVVIEAIKGTQKGENFLVKEKIHSCARPYNLEIGQTYFIAGKKSILGAFKGEWNAKEAGIW